LTGGSLFVLVAVHLVLTAMPAVAAALTAVHKGVRNVPVLLCVGLAAGGAAAMAVFWAYYLGAGFGHFCAYALFFGSVGVVAWLWPAVSRGHGDLLRQLAVPLGLWALGSVFLVFFGFLHGGAEASLETASYRFSTQPSPFASDSSIPAFFSDWMYAGAPGSPPIFPPEWHLSDRPPLQAAYVLTQRVFGWDTTGTHYQVLGVILQQLWIVGMWALLLAARVSARTRALAIAAALLCDVAIVNGFYVWPKLLGTAFVLAALALVVAPRESTLREQPITVVLLGALAALAFLAHGTSVFGLIPVAAVALWRGLPDWRWLAAGAAVLLLLVLPWAAFQRYEDPPGNRLAKWSLAGVAEIDERGVLETIVDEYSEAGLGTTAENKLQNFSTMAGGNPAAGEPVEGQVPFGDVFTEIGDTATALGDGRFGVAASKVREIRHWHLLWTLGVLLFALPLILFGRLRGDWRDDLDWKFARLCLLVCAIGVGAWGLLMFGSVAGRAVVTQGTLALPLVAIAGVVAGLRATYPRLAGWFVAVNAITVLILYLPKLAPELDNSFDAFAEVAALVSLAGFVVLSFSSWGGRIASGRSSTP
jgi:4-amino-4-deoxy-L-arabinose transferase-like glycosyltransferase